MLDEASPRYPEVKSMHQQNLESFVVRARRVREHSLAKDEELLSATGSGTLQYQAAPGGHQTLRFVVPDEERVESAAARVRPLVLERDPSFYAKALKALRFLASGSLQSDSVRDLEDLAARWRSTTTRNGGRVGYYVSLLSSSDETPPESVTDTQLAWAYIYGDTVHADENELGRTRRFGITQRFRAAARLVCELIQLAMATLALIERIRAQGLLDLAPEAFEVDVIARSPEDDGWTLKSAYLLPRGSLEGEPPFEVPTGALLLDYSVLQELAGGGPRVTPDPLSLRLRRSELPDLGPCALDFASSQQLETGLEVTWFERHGAFEFKVRLDEEMRPTGSALTLRDVSGKDPHDLLDGVRLFSGAFQGGEYVLTDSEGNAVGALEQPPAETVLVDNQLGLIEALVRISDHLGQHELRVPQLDTLTRAKALEIQAAASLLAGSAVPLSWASIRMHLSPGQVAPTSPSPLVVNYPLDLELEGTVLHLGIQTIDWGLTVPGVAIAHDDHEDVILMPRTSQPAMRTLAQ